MFIVFMKSLAIISLVELLVLSGAVVLQHKWLPLRAFCLAVASVSLAGIVAVAFS